MVTLEELISKQFHFTIILLIFPVRADVVLRFMQYRKRATDGENSSLFFYMRKITHFQKNSLFDFSFSYSQPGDCCKCAMQIK